MARRAGWLAWLFVAAPCFATAGDETGAPAPDLETRLFEVGDLLMGHSAFDAEAGPTALRAPAEELHVLEEEERNPPFQFVADLVETVAAVAREAGDGAPNARTTVYGSSLIATRLTPAAQDRVEALLSRLRAERLPAVALDVAVLGGDPAAFSEPGALLAAVAVGRVRVEAGARVVGQVGHRATAFAGRERAFVTGYDGQVAWNAKTVDPIVQIQPEGFAVEATVRAVAPTPVVDLRAWTARIVETREATIGEGARFESLTVDAPLAQATLRLQPGTWAVLGLSADRSLAVRATILAPPPSRPTPSFARVDLPPTGPDSPPLPPGDLGSFDLRDFAARTIVTRGARMGLVGSGACPSDWPSLPDWEQLVPEALVKEVTIDTVDPVGWTREGAGIEVRGSRLLVAQDRDHREAVGSLVAAMRARFVGTLRFRATLVRLPVASFPEWFAGGTEVDRAIVAGGTALLARPGAEVVDSATVRLPRRGVRNESFAGRVRRCVRDYDPEIDEEGATLGIPIVSLVREGISLDVEAAVASGGAGVQCHVRLDRSTWEGLREAPTPHGVVECPDLGLLRVRGGLVVPFGATRLVGLAIEDGLATLVLLSANAE